LPIDSIKALNIASELLGLSIETNDAALEESSDVYVIQGVSGASQNPESKLVYLIKPDGNLSLSWKVDTVTQETSYSSYVDINAAEVVGVSDHVSAATYEV
jgi:extracellular elastinolytic metalloproteinase